MRSGIDATAETGRRRGQPTAATAAGTGAAVESVASRSRFARCWFDRTFRPRDFALAVALGIAAFGTANVYANGGNGGQGGSGTPGAGGTFDAPQGGDGTGTSGGGGGGSGGGPGSGGGAGGGGAGGDGGAHGVDGAALPAGDITGTDGQNGADAAGAGQGGGGGGAGGFGARLAAAFNANVAAGQTVAGGNGGNGGSAGTGAFDGNGGDGGIGIWGDGGNLSNAGVVVGGHGGTSGNGAGGSGGHGIWLRGGNVNNSGTVTGGSGGLIGAGSSNVAGSNGGNGVVLSDGDLTNAASGAIQGNGGGSSGNTGANGGDGAVVDGGTVTNLGNIRGGAGGANDSHLAGSGANGGTGVAITNGTLDNDASGMITGGAGGGASTGGGSGANGGTGVSLNGGSHTNDGTIMGGGGGASATTGDSAGANGGKGAMLAGAQLINNGTIDGGRGGDSLSDANSTGGNGGSGVELSDSTLINHGTIAGGNGGRSNSNNGSGGVADGGNGVAAQNSTIITSGTISRGNSLSGSPATNGKAVIFGGGTNRLELHAGATFNGDVDATTGGNDTFTLGGTADDSFNVGQIGDARQFRGFEQYEKTGTSTWSLTGSSAIVTPWTVREGTLAVNADLSGDVGVLPAGTLGGVGTIHGDVTNSGIVAPGNSIGTLLVNGNYAGNGGQLNVEAALGDDGFPADRLLISGNATGTTTVNVINQGGTGADTGTLNTDGASIVQVGGSSTADAFRLAGGYVAVGPYRYELNAFAPGTSAGGELDPRLAGVGTTQFWDYRLQSVLDGGGAPVPVTQIPGYQALTPAVLQYGWASLDNLHSRLGEIHYLGHIRESGCDDCVASPPGDGTETFFRARGWSGEFDGGRGPDFDQDLWFVQTGINAVGWDVRETGDSLRFGLAFTYGQSDVTVPVAGNSETGLKFRTPALALIGTYQAADGWYVDTILQGSHYNTDVSTTERGEVADFDGAGLGASIEAGYPILVGPWLIFEPQAQLAYQRMWFDDFTDADGIAVSYQNTDGLQGRIGGRLQRTFVGRDSDRMLSPFVNVDVLQGFINDGSLTASNVAFLTDTNSTAMQFGGGVNGQFGKRWALYASGNYIHGLDDGGLDHAWTGTGGVRFNF